jgi:hypothetical protein
MAARRKCRGRLRAKSREFTDLVWFANQFRSGQDQTSRAQPGAGGLPFDFAPF